MSSPINGRFISTRILFPDELAVEATPIASSSSSINTLHCDEEISENLFASSRKRERHSVAENQAAPKVQRIPESVVANAEGRVRPQFELSCRTELRRQAVSKLYADKSRQITPAFNYLALTIKLIRGEIERQIPPSENILQFLRYGCNALKDKECEIQLKEAIGQLQEACIKLRSPCSASDSFAAIQLRDQAVARIEEILKRVEQIKNKALKISEDVVSV